jgi:hypothetical protein
MNRAIAPVHVTLLSPLFILVGPLAAESKFQHQAWVVVGMRSHTEPDATARRRKRKRWSSPPYAQVVQGLAQGARGRHPTHQHPVSAFAPSFSSQSPRFHASSSCRLPQFDLQTAPCRLRNGSARFLPKLGQNKVAPVGGYVTTTILLSSDVKSCVSFHAHATRMIERWAPTLDGRADEHTCSLTLADWPSC